ncbi:MAG TPA: PDZ domain-containing protein [Burkholderiaceae bacterium]|nr:PDZ domain-containing protein [Burkholderiaceae bacterium]
MTLRYAIRPANPAAHLFHVICCVERPDPAGQLFMLPAWIPGSYMIREFARNIVRISAVAGRRRVPIEKLDKHTWRAAPCRGPLEVACEVYAWDHSVRSAHLDETQGFFNGTSVFLLPIGHEHDACSVDILPPAGREHTWRVVTALDPQRGVRRLGFGTYVARDYDEMIDCPVALGEFDHARFDVLGVPHDIAVSGRVPKLDVPRLTTDLARMCEQQIRLFEPRRRKAPFSRYTFLVQAAGDGYGGLEHRNSTALICKRDDLPFVGMKDSTEGYRNFLGLASHEYFHAWNVKRIRPAAFVPYDLTQENYTRLLWAFEGFTSYYDDLMLVRAGLLTQAQYLETVGKTMSTVLQRSGRLKQSVSESSFDAWIKYYRADENAPNSVVSYYQKGALIGLALDLVIRAETRGRRSLDDVMRLMWRQWKRASDYRGIEEDEFARVAEEATGLALASLIHEWTEGTRDPDFARLLKPFGIEAQQRPAVDSAAFAMLGVQIAAGAECRLAHVFDATPGQAAGLSGGDIVIAIGGLRATTANLDKLLLRYAPGDRVEIAAFRRDELMRFTATLAQRPPSKSVLGVDPKAGASPTRMRSAWLGQG